MNMKLDQHPVDKEIGAVISRGKKHSQISFIQI